MGRIRQHKESATFLSLTSQKGSPPVHSASRPAFAAVHSHCIGGRELTPARLIGVGLSPAAILLE